MFCFAQRNHVIYEMASKTQIYTLSQESSQTLILLIPHPNRKKNYVLRILKHFEDKDGKEFIVGYGIGVTQLKNAEEQVPLNPDAEPKKKRFDWGEFFDGLEIFIQKNCL